MFKHVKLVELPVTDQDRAVWFYTEQVGLNLFRDSAYHG
jgi:predicted enzyme related to lactoylglutathione lyase